MDAPPAFEPDSRLDSAPWLWRAAAAGASGSRSADAPAARRRTGSTAHRLDSALSCAVVIILND